MLFKHTNRPNVSPFSTPLQDMGKHADTLEEHRIFWQQKADETDISALHQTHPTHASVVNINDVIIRLAVEGIIQNPTSDRMHNVRDHFFGTLAASMLVRELLETGIDETAVVCDFRPGIDEPMTAQRVHITKDIADGVLPPSEASSQWYHQKGLYVERVTPAAPSEPLEIAGAKAEAPFIDSHFVTLYPHVELRANTIPF